MISDILLDEIGGEPNPYLFTLNADSLDFITSMAGLLNVSTICVPSNNACFMLFHFVGPMNN